MTLTPLTFDSSPDRLAFEARKYGNRGLWLMLLPTGRVAVAEATRQLIATLDPSLTPHIYHLLVEADRAPPAPPPTRPSLPGGLDDDPDLELRI